INRLGKYKGMRALAVFGGQHMDRQIKALKDRPQIVVATPGRLLDHIRRRTIRLSDIKVAVLDEADEMLNMGFIDDIKEILKQIPKRRQTLWFTARMGREIRGIARTVTSDPVPAKMKARERTVRNTRHTSLELPSRCKRAALTKH